MLIESWGPSPRFTTGHGSEEYTPLIRVMVCMQGAPLMQPNSKAITFLDKSCVHLKRVPNITTKLDQEHRELRSTCKEPSYPLPTLIEKPEPPCWALNNEVWGHMQVVITISPDTESRPLSWTFLGYTERHCLSLDKGVYSWGKVRNVFSSRSTSQSVALKK